MTGSSEHREKKSVDLWASPHGKRKLIYLFANHSAAGGVGELWSDLAHGLNQRGYDTKLIALWRLPHSASAAEGRGTWHHVLPRKPTSASELIKLSTGLLTLFRKNSPDWVLTAMPAANLIVPTFAAITGKGTRVITTHHTPASTLSWFMSKLDRYAAAMPNVRAAVNVSNAVAASYASKLSWISAKQHVIHNALSLHVEHQLAALSEHRRIQPRIGDKFHVVALGRLSAQKNFDVLIAAAQFLPNINISIVGKGPDETKLQDLAERLGVQDRITFHGFMVREAALKLLASGDVFVQTSRFEGHSLALIEAAKLGLPMIVSNIPVQIEGITDEAGTICAITIDPDDVVGLAESILRLSSDSILQAHLSSQALRIGRESSFEGMISQYEAILEI